MAMTQIGNDKIWEKLMHLSMLCGINQRYQQMKLTDAVWWSEHTDAAVATLTLITLALAIVAYFIPKQPLLKSVERLAWLTFDRISVGSAIVAALGGIVLIIMPESNNVRLHSNLFQGWSDLRQDVDSVISDAEAETQLSGDQEQGYLERRYRELLAKKNALNAREPAPDLALIKAFRIAEQLSRGSPVDENGDALPDPDEKKTNEAHPESEPEKVSLNRR
jgi:hypothetical protein